MSIQILQKVHERFSYLFNGTNQTKTLFRGDIVWEKWIQSHKFIK